MLCRGTTGPMCPLGACLPSGPRNWRPRWSREQDGGPAPRQELPSPQRSCSGRPRLRARRAHWCPRISISPMCSRARAPHAALNPVLRMRGAVPEPSPDPKGQSPRGVSPTASSLCPAPSLVITRFRAPVLSPGGTLESPDRFQNLRPWGQAVFDHSCLLLSRKKISTVI